MSKPKATKLTDLKRKLSISASSSKKTKVEPDQGTALQSSILEDIQRFRSALAPSVKEFKFNKQRVRVLTQNEEVMEDAEAVVYWMSRDQRVQDNWAFLYSQRLAFKMKCSLMVCFCLVPKFLDATIRQFDFMLQGLAEVETECQALGISFYLLTGLAKDVLPDFICKHKVGAVVCDFSPLRIPTSWVDSVKELLPNNVPLCQVDAHNLVPCWSASDKLEYGARTIRGRITKKLPEFLTEFPPVIKHPHPGSKSPPTDWVSARASLQVDQSVKPVTWLKPGTKAGLLELEVFCHKRLKHFAELRNNPNNNYLSNLSPWIHFGQLSVQRCILTVQKYKSKYTKSVEAYVEEAVVRRELADNYCYYCPKYDSIEGAWDWAQKTLKLHAKDKREKIYSREKLEEGKTHDMLWNAAQLQMVREGKMHGFMRMYWAKKILEWTESPETALADAIYLNDKYQLDGRDANGYVGCMWSICGLHDQGWAERPVFGKIRYMNYKGCQRKFDVDAFIMKYCSKKK